ncbi:MAG: 30S ribosomal protein S16 [Flavobacteriales bacterium]
MATRIRLQRHGKKGKPFFHLVAADSRAKRDGKFIEKLGTYNPTANPAVINIDFDATLAWVQHGAEMSDTARAILSYKGVLYKNHLLNGVKKGALTAEQVEERFNKWLAEKEAKIDNKISGLAKSAEKAKADRFAAEAAANAAKAAAVEAKNTPAVEEVADEVVAEEAPATEEVVAEEAPATEEVVAEEASATEEVVAEEAPATEEVVAEEAPATEEVVAEEAPATEEAPAAEEASEEAAAE